MRRLITMLTGAIVLLVVGLFSVDASADYYVRLNQNGNWSSITDKNIYNQEQEFTFYSDVEFVIDDGFGGYYGPWSDYDMSNTNGSAYASKKSDSYKFKLKKGIYKIKGTWEYDDTNKYNTIFLRVTKTGDVSTIADGYRLFGTINGASVGETDNTYLFTSSNPLQLTVTGTTQFKISEYNNGAKKEIYSAWNGKTDGHDGSYYTFTLNPGDSKTYENCKGEKASDGGSQFVLSNGSYEISMNGSNLTVKRVTVVERNLWVFAQGNEKYKQFVQNGNTFTATGFVCNNTNTDWIRLFDGSDTFAPSGNDETIEPGKGPYTTAKYAGVQNKSVYKFKETGTYTINATYNTSSNVWQFTVEKEPGFPTLYFYKNAGSVYEKVGELKQVGNTDNYAIELTSYTTGNGNFALSTDNKATSALASLNKYGPVAYTKFNELESGEIAISKNSDNYFGFGLAGLKATVTAHWNSDAKAYDKMTVKYEEKEAEIYLYIRTGNDQSNNYECAGKLERVGNSKTYTITSGTKPCDTHIFVLSSRVDDGKSTNWEGLAGKMYGASEAGKICGNTELVTLEPNQGSNFLKFDSNYKGKDVEIRYFANTSQISVIYSDYGFEDGYYLSGDFNNWKNCSDGLASNAEFAPYKFVPVDQESKNKYSFLDDSWYMVKITGPEGGMPENKSGKFHGQFQIYTNADMTKGDRWASKYTRDNVVGSDYWKNSLADNPTSLSDVTTMGYKDGPTLSNMHLKHNYYQNAVIYFKPAKNNNDSKCFVSGQPQDIYVYYYNQNEVGETRDEKIVVDQNQLNTVNYSVNPEITGAVFELYDIPTDGMIPISTRNDETVKVSHPALKDLKGQKVIRSRVAPGLEESYKTSAGTFYYAFKVSGADKIDANESFAFDGEDIFFINYNLAAITLNLIDKKDQDVTINSTYEGKKVLESITYRLIAIDGTAGPRYVTTTAGGRTNKPADAWIFEMDKYLHNGDNDFVPVNEEGVEYRTLSNGDNHRMHWNGVAKKEAKASIAALADAPTETTPAWVQESETVPLTHSNRYVEIEVKFADLDGIPTPVQYISDFTREPEYGPDGKETGVVKLTHNGTQNFKLDGNHKYFVHKFENIATDIDEIEVEEVEGNVDGNAEAVYYTLQGVKTEKPVKGQIYIVVRGNKSSKIVY